MTSGGLAAVSSSFFAALYSAFGKYDVVHIHAEGPAFFSWLPKMFGKRVVVTIHGIDWQREKWKSGFGSKFIRQGEKNAVKYADEIVVLSKGVQDYFKDTYGRETRFIPNGVNRPEIQSAKLITEKFDLTKDSYILFLGRLVPEKGLRYLIEAFKAVKTNKKLVIAGGSSDTDSFMKELQESAKSDNRIIFTGFVQGQKRYSFSSSIGTKWTSEENDMIKPLLQRFDKISVREELASEWIEELMGEKPTVTCDPTVLWEPSFWNKFVLDGYAPKGKYVLIYAVNPDKRNISDGIEYAKKKGIPAYFINFYTPIRGTKTIRPTNVKEWITLFAKADTIFSASYHGLLFSLYFKKNVFFYNRGEKSRMISLSKSLKIENREGNAENIEKDSPIDYATVWEKLEQKRTESWKVLESMFN